MSWTFLEGLCLILLVFGQAHRNFLNGILSPWISVLLYSQPVSHHSVKNLIYIFIGCIDPLTYLDTDGEVTSIVYLELYQD